MEGSCRIELYVRAVVCLCNPLRFKCVLHDLETSEGMFQASISRAHVNRSLSSRELSSQLQRPPFTVVISRALLGCRALIGTASPDPFSICQDALHWIDPTDISSS